MKRCDYHGLVRGLDYLAGTAEWSWEPIEQCPHPATRYVRVDGEHATSYDHVCDEHDTAVRQMPGFVSSEPLVGVS